MTPRYDPCLVDGFAVDCIRNGVRMNTRWLNEDTRTAAVIALADTCYVKEISWRVGVTELDVHRILKAHKRKTA